jgi:arylsulfatase A-like enzyme
MEIPKNTAIARAGFVAVVPMGRRFMFACCVLMAVALLSLIMVKDARAQASSRPNIVLIVSDYMGYSDIGPYGATDVRTPSLDSIAVNGVRFLSYYAASPVCGPSRAALLSGFYPARVRMETNVPPDAGGLSSENGTLVRELEAAGYRTAMVGKWHLGRRDGFSPLSHGFDNFYGFYDWTLGYHTHLNSAGEPGLYRGDELVSEDGYLTELLTTEATRFIEGGADAPFFLYLAYNVGLPPYQAPDLPEAQWSSGWNVNEATRDDYVAMVEAMDEGIGRVLSKLDELDLTENTLVIFTYDHGGQDLVRSDPLFHGFGTLWEGGIRVPLLMRWPARFEKGQEIDRPSIAMDLTATMLDAAGRSTDALQLDGTTLLPLLADGVDVPAETLFWRFRTQRAPMRAARRGNWKFVIDADAQFLFDLDADIGERSNQFFRRPDIANELRQALVGWGQSLAGESE